MSLQLYFLDALLRLTVKRRFKKRPNVLELRPIMAEMAARPARVPPDVAIEQSAMGGVRTEVLRPAGAQGKRAILYIHGGGWVAGAPVNHCPITGRLAKLAGATVYAPDYRLAPEHRFPAGLDDCVAVYRALLDSGIAAGAIAIAGDSAGGNLTLATALKIKMLGLPLPAALVCLSPATALDAELPSHRTNIRSDAMFVAGIHDTVRAAYLDGHDASDPMVSPLRGDVSGLPPTLIQCSGSEMLRDDGVEMAEKMKAAGVDARIEVWPGLPHVWQAMADLLPEGRKAIAGIAAFLNARLAAA